MAAKITDIDVFVLRAPDSGRAHWVSHFVVPRANELLVRLRTADGVDGFGLATCYGAVQPVAGAFRDGIGEQIVGADEAPVGGDRTLATDVDRVADADALRDAKIPRPGPVGVELDSVHRSLLGGDGGAEV